MTEHTRRMVSPYPSRETDPWFDDFESYVNSVDSSQYAYREDRNIIFSGGGTLSWDATTGMLAWSESIEILAAVTGYKWLVEAGNVIIETASGVIFYAVLDRGPGSNSTVPTATANKLGSISPDNVLVIAVRIGDTLYFQTGISLVDGSSVFGIAPLGGNDPDAIHDNVDGEIDAILPKVTPVDADLLLIEDSADAFSKKQVTIGSLPVDYEVVGSITTVNAGDAAVAGVNDTTARGDHQHAVATAIPVSVGTANAEGGSTSLARANHVHDSPGPTTDNKNMTASVTVADDDQATVTAIVSTPALDSYVQVVVNGLQVVVGDGIKVSPAECFFSDDGGITPKAISGIESGDTLHWIGSVAGFELAATDRIDLNYIV